jgi:hypothetical protein
MNDHWPFHDSPNVAVITLVQIIEQGHPVLYVTRDDDDGAWQFLDGSDTQIEAARVASLRSMITLDPTLLQLADLPLGWYAWRASPTAPWQREPRRRDLEAA